MENGVDFTLEMTRLDALDEVVLVEIIRNFAIDQILWMMRSMSILRLINRTF